MTPLAPDIEFHQIRVHGSPASRAGGYEELSSLLIMDGIPGKVDWPSAPKFDRFGNPDGGREGCGVLPNGDVWAWQSKYLFEFTDKEAAQVEKSVKRALDTEPTLKKYVVALPYDLPAGDTTTKKGSPVVSAFTRWEKKKAEWEALASAKGMTVEFIFVGQSDLTDVLTSKVENAGRVRYWFGASVLSTKEQQDRLADVVAAAGRRYTPKLHVEVDAAKVLEGLGRSAGWVYDIRVALAGLRRARAAGWRAPSGDADLQKLLEDVVKSLALAELAMETFLTAARTVEPLPDPLGELGTAESALDAAGQSVRKHVDEHGLYIGEAATAFVDIRSGREAVGRAVSLLHGHATAAARRGLLLMTGRAGVGKTHLFCDVASRRAAAARPTVVVLGQDFDSTTLLPQIGNLAQIDGNLDDALQVLDAAGEAAGCAAMLMVDAINEGADATRWAHALPRLMAAVDRFPYVVLAVSCRTEFVDPVVGTLDPGIPRMEHLGFVEATEQAVDRYTSEYGLERFAFPILNPEFGNPLFLKLACEALSTLGEKRFALGATGLATVIEAFLDAVNVRLSEVGRCDYDPKDQLVQKVAREVAARGAGPYGREDVKAIAEAALPGKSWSQSLFAGLLREGVFMETRDDGVYFAYQRLGDILRASLLAESSQPDVQAWFVALKPNDVWVEIGVIGALAVLVPEKFGVELPDLFAADDGSVLGQVADAFLESLALRSPDDTTDRTAELAERLLDLEDWRRGTWAALLRVACIPGHATNAEWTHKLLLARELTARDLSWSEWLIGSTDDNGYEDENAVGVLLDWGWPKDADADSGQLPDDVARLATLILGWMLTTPDRRVRDRATKALVSVGERGIEGFAKGLTEFAGCDDSYVIERLAAAACAVTLRAVDLATIVAIADAAAAMVAGSWPENLLTRDYLRRTSAAARAHGWDGPEWLPPYGAVWPPAAKSYEEIEEMDAGPDYRYASIWSSVHGQFGDFGRYIIEPAIDHFDVPEKRGLRHLVERVIFTRVLELGWTPEEFDDVERGRRGGHDGPVERYGKKYQWIAFYEVLGRLADNFQLKDRSSTSDDPFPYVHPEQVVYRDIDPTVLIHGGILGPGEDERPWFAPVAATFPDEVAEDYPEDLDGVPDPVDLITLTSPDGTQWLSLVRHGSWTQVHPPEIAALKAPNLNVWVQIRGYLVPSADVPALRNWVEGPNGEGQDWDGRWMAENAEVHSSLLGALPGSPDWDWADGNAEPRSIGDRVIPAELSQPVAWYGGTGTDRDAAGTDEATGFVPSRMLFDLLQLRPGRDFQWTDDNGLAVQDPSAGMNEASTLLLRRDLTDRLADVGFSLFWTVLLNKQRHNQSYGRPDDDYRWVSASGSYVVAGSRVELIASNAWRCQPGEGRSTPITWDLKTSE
ncbi:NACHT domain-containing NTPase [Microbacterium sp.]|uniref:NACHT domain-containing protein n=1 Tax=Microbacterium sp. TaxID=51671 RepID=UPI00273717A7|nr:hypothetical protein [Microbacterium sp.]MDP3949177.1 hypothetical protein [Microbacterium sp.]